MGKGGGRIIAGAALTALGALTGQGWLIQAGVSLVLGGAAQSLAKRPDLSIRRRDLGQQVAEPVGSLPVTYGTVRLGAQRVFMESTNDGFYLWIVGALQHGAVRDIGRVYFDNILAIEEDGLPVQGTTKATKFRGFAHVWKAYGTDGQRSVVPRVRAAGAIVVTGNIRESGEPTKRRLTFGSAHGFALGDCVGTTAVDKLDDAVGYTITAVPSTTVIVIETFEKQGTDAIVGAAGGTVDYYTPDLTTLFGSRWTTEHRGKGVAHVVLRLGYNADRFPNGLPRITVETTGQAVEDPRTATAKVLGAVTAGAAIGAYASTALVACTAHGFSEGDIVLIAGSSATGLNGRQRVDAVIDANTFRVFTDEAGTGAGGTATRTEPTTNPMVALRDYLTSDVYGLGVPTTELAEAEFETEANHCDEQVYAPTPDTVAVFASKAVVSASAANPCVITTDVAHGYDSGDIVEIRNNSAALVNARWTITVLSPTTFSIPLDLSAGPAGAGGIAQRQAAEARFAIAGALDAAQALKTNLEQLLTTARAQLVYQGGQYRPTIRRAGAVALAFTEDDIVGGWSFAGPGQREQANSVRATFLNPARDFQFDQVDYPSPGAANGFLDEDAGFLSRRDVELPLVTNRAQALRIAQVLRRESRLGIRGTVLLKERALQVSVGDLISLTHETPGWDAKPFWVLDVAILPDATVRLALEEYDETAYDLEALDDTPFADTTTLPDRPQRYALVCKARVLTTGQTSMVIRVVVADLYPQGVDSATITYSAEGLPNSGLGGGSGDVINVSYPSVTPASGQVVTPGDSLDDLDGNYVDFTVPLPKRSTPPGRITFTVTAADRADAVDAIDLPPVQPNRYRYFVDVTRMRFNASTNKYELWYRAYKETVATGAVVEDPTGLFIDDFTNGILTATLVGSGAAATSITLHEPKEADGWRFSWDSAEGDSWNVALYSIPLLPPNSYLGESLDEHTRITERFVAPAGAVGGGFSGDAAELTGTTLSTDVTASSLTSVGTLTSLTVSGLAQFTGSSAKVFGTDPGGSELVRIGGSLRVSGVAALGGSAELTNGSVRGALGATGFHETTYLTANLRYAIGADPTSAANWTYINAAGANSTAGMLMLLRGNGGVSGNALYVFGAPVSTGAGAVPASFTQLFKLDGNGLLTVPSLTVTSSVSFNAVSALSLVLGIDPGGAERLRIGGGLRVESGAVFESTVAVTGALTASGGVTGALSGNATTATTLQNARTINGVSFNGSANITVAAAAGTLTGGTLAPNVLGSSLTSLGNLSALTVSGTATLGGAVNFTGSSAKIFGTDPGGLELVRIGGTLRASGAVTLQTDLSVGGNLAVTGTATANGFTAAGTVTGQTFSGTGTTASTLNGSLVVAAAVGTSDAYLRAGFGRASNGYAYLDLVGDTTYTTYGFRILRGNGGANTFTTLTHRGTGQFQLIALDAAALQLYTSNVKRYEITASGDHIFGVDPGGTELMRVGGEVRATDFVLD